MIRLAQRILNRFGLELRRIPRPPACHIPPEEIVDLESLLTQFAATHPQGSELSDFNALRGYLSNSRLGFFHELVQTIRSAEIDLQKRRIADVGCGTGYLLRLLDNSYTGCCLYGFDTYVAMNDLARKLCPAARVLDKSIDDIEDHFDVIFCTEVLEHLVEPEKALRKLLQLTENGTVILTVPNGRIDQLAAGEQREDGTAYWGHINFWSPESWKLFLVRHSAPSAIISTYLLPSGENVGIIQQRDA